MLKLVQMAGGYNGSCEVLRIYQCSSCKNVAATNGDYAQNVPKGVTAKEAGK